MLIFWMYVNYVTETTTYTIHSKFIFHTNSKNKDLWLCFKKVYMFTFLKILSYKSPFKNKQSVIFALLAD
jgi:hypothetical protein